MNMNNIVKIYNDECGWYHVYDNDAKVVSNIFGYKLYKRNNDRNAVGFPCVVLDKIKNKLEKYKIGYSINGKVIIEFPSSNYETFLNKRVNDNMVYYTYPSKILYKDIIVGKFTIKYSDEELERNYEIGEDINPEAGIIKFVNEHSLGYSGLYNNFIVQIINKDFKTIKVELKDEKFGNYSYKYGKYNGVINDDIYEN